MKCKATCSIKSLLKKQFEQDSYFRILIKNVHLTDFKNEHTEWKY